MNFLVAFGGAYLCPVGSIYGHFHQISEQFEPDLKLCSPKSTMWLCEVTFAVDVLINVLSDLFWSGLHNLCHPTIRDGSTWSKFGARGEHGDVFLFSNLGAL